MLTLVCSALRPVPLETDLIHMYTVRNIRETVKRNKGTDLFSPSLRSRQAASQLSSLHRWSDKLPFFLRNGFYQLPVCHSSLFSCRVCRPATRFIRQASFPGHLQKKGTDLFFYFRISFYAFTANRQGAFYQRCAAKLLRTQFELQWIRAIGTGLHKSIDTQQEATQRTGLHCSPSSRPI